MSEIDYEYLLTLIKDAIFSECDGTYFKEGFEFGVVLHEMNGKQIEEFAERIATEIHNKLK